MFPNRSHLRCSAILSLFVLASALLAEPVDRVNLHIGTGDGVVAYGGIPAGNAAGDSPRSIASSRRVSRSIARTASHDDSAATSTVRLRASGEPAANNCISGRLVDGPAAVNASSARMSAWSAGMS